jgi:predicted membrane-bound spermidine synthase
MSHHRHTPIILLLTFCTGFSGLVYEVTWQSYIANLIGSHARSAAIIVAVFLGGLSLGYAVFGRISQKYAASSLMAIYALTEIAIGAWGLIFPQFFQFVATNTQLLPQLPVLAEDLLTSIILIALPTILMGGTLPLLTQALAKSIGDSASLNARIYATNTAGAFVGAIAAGFIILPALGLPLTVMTMGLVNIAAGVIMVLLSRRGFSNQRTIAQPEVAVVAASAPSRKVVSILFVSLLSGFISIATQMIVIRLIGLSAGASQYSFSMGVGAFIMMLALGAWRFSASTRRPITLWINQALITIGLAIILLSVPLWPYWSHVLRALLTSVPANFTIYYIILFCGFSAVLLCAVATMGNTLPTLFRLAQTDLLSLGTKVGRLYAVNTLGCVLGALLGGYLALYYFDFFDLLRILITLSLISTITAAFVIERSGKIPVLILSLLCIFFLATVSPWPIERLSVGTFRLKTALSATFSGADAFYSNFLAHGKILAYKDDPNTTVAVRQTGNNNLSIYVNGKSDGSTQGSDRMTTKLLSHLPLLLRETAAKKVAVIGYGTGITAGTAASYPSVSNVEVIEIAPFIKDFAPLFDAANGNSSKNEKINWHIEDAYRFFTRKADQGNTFDVIISEPSNPWVSGVERLYAREFYDIAKSRLSESGVYAQWFHSYSISKETLALVLNTFTGAWPHVRIFSIDMDLILLGSLKPIDLSSLIGARQLLQLPDIAKDLSDTGFPTLESLLAREIQLPSRAYQDAGIQTLEFPKLSYSAGYDFFLDGTAPAPALADDSRWRGASYALWQNSLLALQLNDVALPQRLETIARNICRVESPLLTEGWQRLERRCRQALIAWAVQTGYSSNSASAQAVIESLTPFVIDGKQLDSADTIAQAARVASNASEYTSPWLMIDLARFEKYAEICFDSITESALSCRLQIAQLALWQRDPVRAKRILSSIPEHGLAHNQALTFREMLKSVR